jgi:beta-glucosidase
MIGTNNTGDRQEDPATTAAGIRRLLDEIAQRQPRAQVLLLAIFPRDKQPDSRLRRINEAINTLIAGHADGRRVHFLNINAALMNADGTLSEGILPDLLHLSEAGYRLWAEQVSPRLERLMAH